MNNKLRRAIYSLGVLICTSACAFASFSFTKVNAEDNFNFALNGSNSKEIGFGSILKQAIGEPIDEREVAYLDSLPSHKLQYNETFNGDNIHTARVKDDLYIFADESTYYDESGRSHVWKPTSVDINGSRYNFVNFDNLNLVKISDPGNNIDHFDVKYEMQISLASSQINPSINIAYNDVQSMNEHFSDYLAELEKYKNMSSSYEEYLEREKAYQDYVEAYHSYQNKYENYLQYLEEYNLYCDNLEKYEQYLKDKQAYDEAMIKYRENQDEWVYYNENHERNLKEYNEFGRKYDESRYQIEAMNIANTEDTFVQNTIKGYITGSTVTEVLSKKDELSALGVSMLVVDEADIATKYLRTALREYFALKTNEEKYAYYFTNYKYIVSNTLSLTRCLANLIKSKPVVDVCRDKGKENQFKMLICALIYFSNAISDKPVYNYEAWIPIREIGDLSRPGAAILDENYEVLGGTYKQTLKGFNFFDTSKVATPSTGIWPTQQVVLIPEPEHMAMPVAPEVVKKAVEPEKVEEPVAPTPVIQPTPYDPDATEPVLPAELQIKTNMQLVEAYREGKIVQHSKLSENADIKLSGIVSTTVAKREQKLAIFVDYLDQPLQYVLFNPGDSISYNKEEPTKPGDIYFKKYLFDHWSDGHDGDEINLNNLTESLIIYPVFDKGDQQRYQITWNINGQIYTTDVLAGKIPTSPIPNPSKPETSNKYYIFNGFVPALTEAVSNATYTASFIEKNIFNITYKIDGNSFVQKEKEDYLPNIPWEYDTPKGTHYEILEWDKPITTISGNTTYTATNFKKYYTITWKYDNVTEKTLVLKNSPVSYDEVFPVLRKDDGYYTFNWNSHNAYAIDNEVITGGYVRNSYPVVVLTIDIYEIVLTGQYIPGDEIVKPDVYYGETYYYEILGWTDNGSGNFIADFVKHSYFDEQVSAHLDHGSYVINASKNSDNSLNISDFLCAINQSKLPSTPISIHFRNGDVNLTVAQVEYIALKNITNISLNIEALGNNQYNLALYFKNELGEMVNIPDLIPSIRINRNLDYIHSYLYLDGQKITASFDEQGLNARIHPNQIYNIIPTYNVELQVGTNINASISQTSGNVGDKVHLDYKIANGFRLQEISIHSKSGKPVSLDSNNDFIIPASDVVIQFVVVRETYTLELIVDDQIFATYSCRYGDVITLPTYVKKVGTEEYEFVFAGWGIYSESIEIKGNTTLTAQFNKIAIEKPSEKQSSEILNLANIITISVIGAGLVAGVTIILIKLKKPKHLKEK